MTRVSECAEDGSEIRLLLTLNVILSLVILGVQGVWIFRAWRTRNSASYQLQVEMKEKNAPLDESLDRLDLNSQEAITLAPETQGVDSTYVSLQREMAVMPDLGFEQDVPGVDEVSLRGNVKDKSFIIKQQFKPSLTFSFKFTSSTPGISCSKPRSGMTAISLCKLT